MSKELQTAVKAAKEAGEILKYYFRNKELEVESKGGVDIVTQADIKSEEKIISIIKKEYPKHQIIAEESGFQKSQSDYKWIIDPLDGTVVYSRGFPEFAVSIALQKNNETILGVVYNPTTGGMYHSEKGEGAYLNEKKISVSKKGKLKEALIGTGFGYGSKRGKKKLIEILDEVNQKSQMLRSVGSAALEMCYVASGKNDGYWELTIKPWDIAAGKLIVEEAGGKVTSGKENDFDVMNPVCIATNGLIHNEMQKIIKKYV